MNGGFLTCRMNAAMHWRRTPMLQTPTLSEAAKATRGKIVPEPDHRRTAEIARTTTETQTAGMKQYDALVWLHSGHPHGHAPAPHACTSHPRPCCMLSAALQCGNHRGEDLDLAPQLILPVQRRFQTILQI